MERFFLISKGCSRWILVAADVRKHGLEMFHGMSRHRQVRKNSWWEAARHLPSFLRSLFFQTAGDCERLSPDGERDAAMYGLHTVLRGSAWCTLTVHRQAHRCCTKQRQLRGKR